MKISRKRTLPTAFNRKQRAMAQFNKSAHDRPLSRMRYDEVNPGQTARSTLRWQIEFPPITVWEILLQERKDELIDNSC
jgi:hypothetical protein